MLYRLALLVLLIFTLGPHIAIGSVTPLASLSARVACLVIFCSLWGIRSLWPHVRNPHCFETSEHSQLLHTLLSWAAKTQARALQKKTAHTPVILLLGMTGSGKTQFILNHALPWEPMPAETLPPTPYLSGYACSTARILELSLPQETMLQRETWEHVYEVLQAHPLGKQIQQVWVMLDTFKLMLTPTPQQCSELNALQQALSILSPLWGTSVQKRLFFQKLDQVAGASEFFEQAPEEIANLVIDLKQTDNPQTAFQEHFLSLSKTLQQQLPEQLHKQPWALKRALIKDFPLQWESLKSSFLKTLRHLQTEGVAWDSVHWVANQLGQTALDHLSQSLTRQFSTGPLRREPHTEPRPLTLTLIEQWGAVSKQPASTQKTLSAVIVFLILTTVYCAHHVYQRYQEAHAIEKKLTRYQIEQQWATHNTQETIRVLKTLQTTIDTIQTHYAHHTGLREKAQLSFKKEIAEKLKPALEKLLRTQLQEALLHNDPHLYARLRLYLALNDPKLSDTLHVFLNRMWHLQTPSWTQAITEHPLSLDVSLIQEARKKVTALPLTERSEHILLADLPNTSPWPAMHQQPLFENFPEAIPLYALHTAPTRTKTNPIFAHAVQTALHGDAVLGPLHDTLSEPLQQKLQQTLFERCEKQSQAYWLHLIQNVRYREPRTQQDWDTQLHWLQVHTEALTQYLAALDENTSLLRSTLPKEASADIAHTHLMLNTLHAFFSRPERASQWEHTLQNRTQALLTAFNQHHATRLLADYQQHTEKNPLADFQESLMQAPEPLRTALSPLFQHTLHHGLHQASQEIQEQAETTLLPFYRDHIEGKYPFNPSSEKEVTLEDFTTFFAPEGLLNTFVENNIAPFLDTATPQWTLQPIEGETLTLPKRWVMQLQLASFVSRLFFPPHAKTPRITMTLQPLSMSPQVAQFSLQIDDHLATFGAHHSDKLNFTWPGLGIGASVRWVLEDKNHLHFEKHYAGTWAWFRALADAEIRPTRQPAQFEMTLGVKPQQVRYLLTTKRSLNPFTPGVLEGIHLSWTP